MKTCRCGTVFAPTGQNHKYCTKACNYNFSVLDGKQKEYRDRANVKMGIRVGIGSGGTTEKGKLNPNYTNGLHAFRNYARELIRLGVPCNKCNVDLRNATRWQWCGHHKDHNRNNNDLNNLEILCKKCHQVHHESHLNFSKVQRLSRKGVEVTHLEAQSILKDDEIV